MFLARLVRKRWLLLVTFTLSTLYLVFNLLSQDKSSLYHEIELGQHVGVRRPFVWQPRVESVDRADNKTGCRNTVQGKVLVVDDRGFVCKRSEILGNGCCMNLTATVGSTSSQEGDGGVLHEGEGVPQEGEGVLLEGEGVQQEGEGVPQEGEGRVALRGGGSSNMQYTCSTCNSAGCCMIYEHCVSCCLRPEVREMLSEADTHRHTADGMILLLSQARDQFELCTLKCRTSSQSVYHENTYRDAKRKHCYGPSQPDLVTPLRK